MKRIVIAVVLSFIGPGLGQIYNKDHRKGILLLLLSTALFFLPAIWLMRKIAPHLPNPEQVTPEKVQAIAAEVIGNGKHFLNLVSVAFLGVWAYAITQAYFRAREVNDREAGAGDKPPEDAAL